MDKKKSGKNDSHYVNNAEFYDALCIWKEGVVEADNSGETRPPVTDYIGGCFIKIAEGLARKACFINYEYKEEMIGDAVENCVLYAHNFDPDKSKNPFAYFTQMVYYAFLRRIQKEKKQMYVKYKVAEKSEDFKNFLRWDDTDPHEKLSLNKMFNLSENDIDKFTKGNKKGGKSGGATLDSVLE